MICWWVLKKPTKQDEVPQALATLTLDNTIAETKWISDTRASNHMKSKLNVLFNIHEYYGIYSVIIENLSSLLILGIENCHVKHKNTI